MSLVTIKNKYQIVIPAKVRKVAGIEVGDFLEAGYEKGRITFTPKVIIDRKHLKKLPKWLKASLRDVQAGRTHGPFHSVEELREHLEK